MVIVHSSPDESILHCKQVLNQSTCSMIPRLLYICTPPVVNRLQYAKTYCKQSETGARCTRPWNEAGMDYIIMATNLWERFGY